MSLPGAAVWSPYDGRPLLPTHTGIRGDDFMPAGWCGGCEHCYAIPVPLVCLACSYDAEGYPREHPVLFPCPVTP